MPHKVDVHVGQRIRQRRWLVGMTQQKLAEMVGIKFQQKNFFNLCKLIQLFATKAKVFFR